MAFLTFAMLVILAWHVIAQLRRDIRIMERLSPQGLLRSPLKRAGIVFLLLIVVPFCFVRCSGAEGLFSGSGPVGTGTIILVSFLISYTWYRYLTWLDPFEREGRGWELAVFIAGCAVVFLVQPLSDLLIPALGLRLDGTFLNDWWYCVIGIGLIEESVKLLPLLAILMLTRQADEPFDLILYGSISALAFAFVENIQYLERTGLFAVGGRALYASVAHMFFTSLIAYAMALARHRGRSMVLPGLFGLLLASLAHGFYNFWLMAPDRPHLITLVFLLGSMHLWVAMKNNLVNLSPHYQAQMRPMPMMFRYRIINALLAIFLFTYVMKFLLEDERSANLLLTAQGTTMAATLLFLAISFSSFRFIPGYVAPLRPKGAIWRFLLPVMPWGEDLTGRGLLLRIPEKRSDARHYMALHRMLPLRGTLAQRVIMDDDHDWYLFRPERTIPFDGAQGDVLMIRPHRENDTLPGDRYVVVVAMAFHKPALLPDGRAHRDQLEFVGFVHGRLL